MRYTTILHEVREQFGLTGNEYCVADIIYHLSNNPKAKNGWCWASRQTLADYIGLARSTTIIVIDTLISYGLVEKNPDTKYLKTTEKWFNAVMKFSPSESENRHEESDIRQRESEDRTTDSPETGHNSNIDNNSNSNSILLPKELGNSPIQRLIKVYSLVWAKRYGFKPEIKWPMIGSLLKKLLESNNEYQIASYIFMHFDWRGTSGEDTFTHNRLSERAFPLELMPKAVNEYKAYIINTMKVDLMDEKAVRKHVDSVLRQYAT